MRGQLGKAAGEAAGAGHSATLHSGTPSSALHAQALAAPGLHPSVGIAGFSSSAGVPAAWGWSAQSPRLRPSGKAEVCVPLRRDPSTPRSHESSNWNHGWELAWEIRPHSAPRSREEKIRSFRPAPERGFQETGYEGSPGSTVLRLFEFANAIC